MKKICKFATALIFAITAIMATSLSAFALTDGDWEFQLLDNEVTVTKYIGTDSDVIMPDTIYNLPVTKMEYTTFRKIENDITSVKFSTNIKAIPDGLFLESRTLTEIDLPDSLETIGDVAFIGCTKLNNVAFPPSMKTIGRMAFQDCTALSDIELPIGLEEIGDSAFLNTKLSEVDLTSHSNLKIEDSAFRAISSLKSIKFPNDIERIPSNVVRDCENLEEVCIPGGVKEIRFLAFDNCKALKNIILPVSLKKIEDSFCGTGIEEVIIPYGVENISSAFAGCPNLQSLYIPDTVSDMSSKIINGSNNCIIYCHSDSKAEEICKKNSISYLTDQSVNSGITVVYNGRRISFHAYGQNPELVNDRTLVPLRSIFEAMGAEVEWQQDTSTITANRKGVKIILQIGNANMKVNEKNITIDTPPMLLNDRTMVPVRVIAEAFGADVKWNDAGRTVLITE